MNKQEVYEDIKKQIIEEKIIPGQWLIERELCAAYGLSRTPIREILWRLLTDGFLEQESNRGFMVRRMSLEQIFEAFQLREAVEGMAARLACRKGNGAFVAMITRIKKELEETDINADVNRGIALGRQIHIAVMETTGNTLMSEIFERLKNLTILTSNITKKSPTIENVSKDAHITIIDALLEKDEEKAEMAMRRHLRDTCRQVVEQFYPGMLTGPGIPKKN